jgi:hypothetical protein
MSEGEFKKRLLSWIYDNRQGEIDHTFVEDLLAEARKDFPPFYTKERLGGTLQQYRKALQENVQVEEEMAKEHHQKIRRSQAKEDLELLEWFVKWFGDPGKT